MYSFEEFKLLNVRPDQKDNEITHFFSRFFVNSVAYCFYLLKFTPNQVTLVFIITGIIGGLLTFNGYLILSYFLWRLHIIIDMADGSVARVTEIKSDYGDILDKVGHHLIYPLYWLGILYATNSINNEPILSIIFYATASSQWTLKHLFKNKELRPQAKNLFKRIIANIIGIEGFILVGIIVKYFEFITVSNYLTFFLISNFLLLLLKVYSLLFTNMNK